jgi:hypothetical protein
MTQTIINLGTGGAALNGQNGSTAGADSNDALFLDWPGDNAGNYVYRSVGSGQGIVVPHEAAFNIAGDIDIRFYFALDSYSGPSDSFGLLNKWGVAGNRSFILDIAQTTSTPRFLWTQDGTTILTMTATSAIPASAGQAIWLRFTLDVDNGSSQRVGTFFTSNDGITFTQLGSTITQSGATSVFATTNNVLIGSADTGQSSGKLYRVQILDGIDGTKVLDVDTSAVTSGAATSFTALTGQTVTINRATSGRKSVAVVSPVWLFGTDDYMEINNNALLNFGATDSFSVFVIARIWATPTNGGRLIAKQPSDASLGWAVRQSTTTFSVVARVNDSTTGVSDVSIASSSGTLSTYGLKVDRVAQTLTAYANGLPSGSPESISAVLSLVNTNAVRIGRNVPTGTNYQDFEMLGVAVFRRALSDSEIVSINSYYTNRAA